MEERNNWEQLANTATDRYRSKEISNTINDGCAESGVNPRLYKAMSAQIRDQVFYDSETDAIMVKDGNDIKYGKDGSPMKVTELIETMREDQPELFLQSTGSGAIGGRTTRRPGVITNDEIKEMSIEEYRSHPLP